MPNFSQARLPHYHHFVLLVWEERGADGSHAAWRFSLQDSQNETRIGFKSLNEITEYLEMWMKDSFEKSENGLPQKENAK